MLARKLGASPALAPIWPQRVVDMRRDQPRPLTQVPQRVEQAGRVLAAGETDHQICVSPGQPGPRDAVARGRQLTSGQPKNRSTHCRQVGWIGCLPLGQGWGERQAAARVADRISGDRQA